MQQNSRFRNSLHRLYIRYDRIMEKQGFTIVLAVCVLVIVFSALYTFHFREMWYEESLEELPEESVLAGSQQSQTLREAQQLVESQKSLSLLLPTEAPFTFAQPVEGFLDRDFSMTEPQLFEQAHYWRLHPGIDLQAEFGTPVTACADGRVLRVWEDAELGLCIRLQHQRGYETIYAGLSNASYVKAGDPVYQGQTIGHVGNGVIAESDAQPHLHFEVWKGQTPVDPVDLFLGLIQ